MYALCQGNRLETLADRLTEALSGPRDNPLAAPWVLTPHPEMGQWLARRLAQANGVSANIHFTPAAAAVWRLLEAANPEIKPGGEFSPAQLTPRIFGLFSQLPTEPAFAPLRRYLEGQDSASQMAFARRLADVFDQYLAFRPDWLLEWEQGRGGQWQGWLWRQLTQDQPCHWARAIQWLGTTDSVDVSSLALPSLHVFGLTTLSPGLLLAIRRFSEAIPTQVYHWTPTEAYWTDVPSPRSPKAVSQEQEPYVSQLLASLGQPLKEVADQLFQWEPNEVDLFDADLPASLLGTLQRELLSFDYAADARDVVADPSFGIRRCTSRQREVEVCRDELQRRFDGDPTLAPDDVLVICPNLDAYLPAIRAEFGRAGSDQWPWRVLGGQAARAFDAGSALLQLLKLLSQPPLDRLFLELLQYPSIQRRFGLGPGQVSSVHRWVQASGLFVDMPEGKFSWQTALDRLVSALTERSEDGVLNGAELAHPSEAEDIGRLFDLLKLLQTFHERLSRPQTLRRWSTLINQLGDVALNPDLADLGALAELYKALAEVTSDEEVIVDLPALVTLLNQIRPPGHLAGGGPGALTVATPAAVRLLPARIIYVLGVTDGEFPAPVLRSELNRMDLSAPRTGDRVRLLEDRLLVLEWISSARDALLLSGRSRNPVTAEHESLSSVLEELTAWCQSRYRIAPDLLARTVPLHGFSAQYGSGETGYSTHFNVAAAAPVERFLTGELPAAPIETIALDDLCRFWRNPAQWFVEQVLGVWLELPEGVLAQLPPASIDGLTRYQLLERALSGDEELSGSTLTAALADSVALPDGKLGLALAAGMTSQAQQLREREQRFSLAGRPADLSVSISLGGVVLEGTVDGVIGERRMASSHSRLEGARELDCWIRHLALCTRRPNASSLLVGAAGALRFRSVEESEVALTTLVEGFVAGQQAPLRFYPGPSRRQAAGKAADFELDYAGASNPYVELAMRGRDPLGPEFEALAATVWQPLFEHESDAAL
ncbi:MAG: exodeoxyribonuclease V subunit gamma [Pseudomonadota bacterium]